MGHVARINTNQYTDPETGLIYLRNRYYDPSTGQFLSRDPADAITRSAYGYTYDNPLNGSDSTGLAGPQNPPDEGSPEAGRPPAPPDPAVWATNDPALSNAEKHALRDKAAGVPYDTAAANSAAQKLKTGRKFAASAAFSEIARCAGLIRSAPCRRVVSRY